MNARTAVRTIRALNARVEGHEDVSRATRKTLNSALFALGLPTLGTARTLTDYTVRLCTPDYTLLRDVCSGRSFAQAKAHADEIAAFVAAA